MTPSAPTLIRVAGIVEDSIVDGPGMRLTVFTQGCPHHCEGCHNPQTHPFDGGTEKTVDELARLAIENPLCAGLTLSGGEPFSQAAACAALAALVRAHNKNVWTYTGYTYEQLLSGIPQNPAWQSLLDQTDVLVDGPFLLAERTLELPFRGSRNQRLLERGMGGRGNDEGLRQQTFFEKKV